MGQALRICSYYFFTLRLSCFIVVIPIALFAYRVYKDWVKRNEIDKTIAAKDETIQALAEQIRQFRVIELKRLGWSDEAIAQVVIQNTPKNALEARELLPKGNDVVVGERGKRKKSD